MKDWDEVYRTVPSEPLVPSAFLTRHLRSLPPGRALDVAAGRGRNALFLAAHGYQVLAVDGSQVAIEQLNAASHPRVTAQVLDLECDPLPPGPFAVIVIVHYLQRSLFPLLPSRLQIGGALLYETYTERHRQYRSMNPDFLLHPDELRNAFPTLTTIDYQDVDNPVERYATASLLAINRDTS